MTDKVNDEIIIGKVLEGDREAFAALVDKYKSGLYILLLGMGASHQDAQDLAQETFINAYRKLSGHNSQSSFAAWLYTIAVNRFRDVKRRKTFSVASNPPNAQIDGTPTPEEMYMRKESELELHNLLSRLPGRYRIVLLLHYTNDLSYEEISAVTGMSLHQVKNRLYRARQKLRKLWLQPKEASHEKSALHELR
ncbi:RNA polymerase sigma-70 factor, ECF subfamily [Paenibacillus sophorae]|uniref:RNA polymerase sigma factor n=1 Tax=Paenibacillus sophorae TaxID=1333845 RepID=A0A1H8FB03_9BACL|nr:sigma-70 family RNA polymerase sigma factor [Paenibacillus sophorae]QWU13803.1 sigma-70 family RNA polymerase sigma factor [Paenibacillus sophorae]SEN28228.1 RNA polymerase sigma-70 factor, ECF subfamily [Paenibacillus sophorae]